MSTHTTEPKEGITARLAQKPFTKRRQLERDIEHITEEMYRRNKELADTNKTLSLLRTIDALVLESQVSFQDVCMQIAKAINEVTDYPFVGLFSRARYQDEQITLYGWSGQQLSKHKTALYLSKPLRIDVSSGWISNPTASRLISLENIPMEAVASVLKCSAAEAESLSKQLPLKSIYIVKLRVRHHLVGILAIGFYTPVEQLAEAEVNLLDRLSENIGVALDNKLLFEENKRVLRQLRESNAKLKALDEAKDDFISMASHQLRTPLTSVKGYLSMVMDGDVGKITPMQYNLLNQAFVSSQRMVYIIADLLNVSRLRTGKFLIEATPVDLPAVISDEIQQLDELAKGHSVKIAYEPPKNFPTLMIDDTKTRQVIMNFIDNALYYTPKGGTVTVKLLDKGSTIELRIEDNGIGVPKDEKHHLFTKFYRAKNARQARPDGTGLGLYMAKKVISAQGGVIIFESEEGKGSTFGFAFNKAKLLPSAAAKSQPEATAAPKS